MSYRCVVIDDEKPARERVKKLLADHEDFEVVGEAVDAASAIRVVDELTPDLCFLDVQMPEGNGFEVLRRVKHLPGVIFTTAYDQYAVRAFEVHSLDYLLKPFSKSRFTEALDRARQSLGRSAMPAEKMLELLERIRSEMAVAEREAEGESPAPPPPPGPASVPSRISARRGSRILLLDPVEVLCFEADETLVFARTETGRFLVERTLADLEIQLPGFFRAHRRYLVNVGRIAEIAPGDAGTYRILFRGETGHTVPLSRRQTRRLRERFPW